MYKVIGILKCRECGINPVIEVSESEKNYRMRCPKCGQQTTSLYRHVENVIEGWNGMNKPNKKKPTYHCGQCGAEIPFGFAVCPKCNTEVEW